MSEEKRRSTDSGTDDIMRMIIEESDPQKRALLVVLNAIKGSLERVRDSNAQTVINLEEHESKFEIHLANFEKFMAATTAANARSSVWWRVGAWGLGIAQMAVIAILGYARVELIDINATSAALLAKINLHETRIVVLEKK